MLVATVPKEMKMIFRPACRASWILFIVKVIGHT